MKYMSVGNNSPAQRNGTSQVQFFTLNRKEPRSTTITKQIFFKISILRFICLNANLIELLEVQTRATVENDFEIKAKGDE